MVPHTHDDVGWLKTVKEYFNGTAEDIQHAYVFEIIDTAMNELITDERKLKRFTYVEMKFFSMWFYLQSQSKREAVRSLVKEGRLEFVNAGWSMHDEAATHYDDMINNMMYGHQFLKREFDGYTPTIGWHIDPFGHSTANPRLFADMGFDAWFFARLDYQDKENRLQNKSMQYLWRPMSQHFGSEKEIMTYAMYRHYSAPPGFDVDLNGGASPISDSNKAEKMSEFKDFIQEMASHYQGNHILIPMGDDFRYQKASINYSNIDNLIKDFQAPGVKLIYSTPSQFMKAINEQDLKWPVNYDDMFPYADHPDAYWSGYFTSRANSKEFIRRGSQ